MGQGIVLQDVRMSTLRKKVEAFATLYDAKAIDVKIDVQGTFKDNRGNLVFLNRGWHIATFIGESRHIYAQLDGEREWTAIIPENGVISQVALAIMSIS